MEYTFPLHKNITLWNLCVQNKIEIREVKRIYTEIYKVKYDTYFKIVKMVLYCYLENKNFLPLIFTDQLWSSLILYQLF